MGNNCSLACAILAFLAQVTLADYFMQITDTSKSPSFVFNERVFPTLDFPPNPAFGSASSIKALLEGAVKISDWDFGVQVDVNLVAGTGGNTGKIYFSVLTIKRLTDGYTPIFFEYLTKSPSTLSLTLAMTSGAGRGAVQLSALYKFSTVYIGNLYQMGATTNSESPKKTLEIYFGQLIMQYGSFGPDGRISRANKWGWDSHKGEQKSDLNTNVV